MRRTVVSVGHAGSQRATPELHRVGAAFTGADAGDEIDRDDPQTAVRVHRARDLAEHPLDDLVVQDRLDAQAGRELVDDDLSTVDRAPAAQLGPRTSEMVIPSTA